MAGKKLGNFSQFCILYIYICFFLRQCIHSSSKGCNILNSVCERGIICPQKVFERGTFSVKDVYKRQGAGPRGGATPQKTLSTLLPQGGFKEVAYCFFSSPPFYFIPPFMFLLFFFRKRGQTYKQYQKQKLKYLFLHNIFRGILQHMRSDIHRLRTLQHKSHCSCKGYWSKESVLQ